MRHDERPHQPRRNSPRGRPYVIELAVPTGELHVERLGEVLPQEVRRTALKRLTVLHERLDGESLLRTGKTFVGRLAPHDNRQRHPVLRETGIDVYHFVCLFQRLFLGFMCRMPLLPEEFGCTEKEPGTHLPTHYIGPLVDKDRQVTVRLYPVLVRIPDDGFGSRTHDKLLFEFRIRVHDDTLPVGIVHQAVVRHHGALLGETLHMVGLTAEKRLGYEKREIGIDMARLLEHVVQSPVHLLPDGISVWLYHHASANSRTFGKTRLHHEVVVPLRIILGTAGQLL